MKRISVNIYLSYQSLFKDLEVWGQVDPSEIERDLSRILRLVETRGERSIFIDFPKCAKSLDNALSRGVLDRRRFSILGSAKNGLPAFMNNTFVKVFNEDGSIKEDADHGAVQALRQVFLLYKKVQIPCSQEKIDDAISVFLRTDRSLRSGSEAWRTGDFVAPDYHLAHALFRSYRQYDLLGREDGASHSLTRLAQRVCDQVVQRFSAFNPDSIIGNHGPGAVADQPSRQDKYVFRTWSQQLERVFPRDHHAAANIRVYDYENWLSGDGSFGDLRTKPARLIPVNKTQETPRLIASEPTANQFIQGGIRKYLRKEIDASVLGNSISIADQSKSMDWAVRASTDDRIATVDLKEASDRLSCWTVERVFRAQPELLAALAASRSQYIVSEVKGIKDYSMLRKYAPQGNASVFPLQSIVYCCLALAAVVWSTPGYKKTSTNAGLWAAIRMASNSVRVYGDDIILPSHALPALSSLLELCQLKVNGAKSHYSGRFAESCGMDAFKGTDVTPVYLASVDDEIKPGNVQSAIDVSNGCYRLGLLNLGNLVMSRVPKALSCDLVASRIPGPSTLLFTYSNGYCAELRVRYNRTLHREEYRTSVVEVKQPKRKREDWGSLLQYFIEAPTADFMGLVDPYESGWAGRGRTRLVRRWEPKGHVKNVYLD